MSVEKIQNRAFLGFGVSQGLGGTIVQFNWKFMIMCFSVLLFLKEFL